MAFNSDTYYANKAARLANVNMTEARKLLAQIKSEGESEYLLEQINHRVRSYRLYRRIARTYRR